MFRWGSAFEAFRHLEREMDQWIRRLDMAAGSRLGRPFPALNLYELDTEYLLVGELPGVDISDLEVSVAAGQLKLSGERKAGCDIADDKYRRSERVNGRWERLVQLPPRILDEAIHAELTNGILKLHLPKLPVTEARKISIVESERPALPGGSP